MLYSILGFNQAKLMETNLNLTDIVLLKYIVNACGSVSMQHKLDENGNPLVWLYHSKILEDLPVLRISESTLRNRLVSLKQDGYITSVSVNNESCRGSKTYYGITYKTELLMRDLESESGESTTTPLKEDAVTRPRHFKVAPDNILKNNNISKDILQPIESIESSQPKEKRMNLYDKCVKEIENYTDNQELRELLTEYLKMRLAMKDKPLYGSNQFKGILNKLKNIGGDPFEIVNYCIERGYASFYAPTEYKKNNDRRKFGETSEVVNKTLTQEEVKNVYAGKRF